MTASVHRVATDRKTGLRLLAGSLALLLLIGTQKTPALGEERGAVVLRIGNGTVSAGLRCQAVLAHFMTRDLAPFAPGGELTIPLQRETATGALLAVGPGGRLIPVENVLCGLDRDWVATRNDLDLTRLREGSTQQLRIVCTEGNGLSCTVAGTLE
jgi:hypothetical protein